MSFRSSKGIKGLPDFRAVEAKFTSTEFERFLSVRVLISCAAFSGGTLLKVHYACCVF